MFLKNIKIKKTPHNIEPEARPKPRQYCFCLVLSPGVSHVFQFSL